VALFTGRANKIRLHRLIAFAKHAFRVIPQEVLS